jgi:hypothetical protein
MTTNNPHSIIGCVALEKFRGVGKERRGGQTVVLENYRRVHNPENLVET